MNTSQLKNPTTKLGTKKNSPSNSKTNNKNKNNYNTSSGAREDEPELIPYWWKFGFHNSSQKGAKVLSYVQQKVKNDCVYI